MAAPIPAAYTTGFNNGYPVLYVIRLYPAGAAAPIYFINQPDIIDIGLPRSITYDGGNLTNGDINLRALAVESRGGAVDFLGEMDFSFQFSEGGGLASRNQCVVRLLNQESLTDTLLDYDIDNAPIEVWQGFVKPTGAIAIDGDLLLLFKGIVSSWEGWNRDITTLNCLDNQHLYDTKIPQRIITATNFPQAPDGLINKPMPILIGDFETVNTQTYGVGSRAAWEIGLYSLAPTVMTNLKTQEVYVSSEPWDVPDSGLYWQDGDTPWVAKMRKITTGSLTDISFDNTASVYTIKRASGSFVTDGFVETNKVLVVSTSGLNDGVYTVTIVAALSLTVTEALTTETAGAAGATSVIAGYNYDGSTYSLLLGPDAYADIYVRPILATSRNTVASWENALDKDQTNYAQVGYVSAFNSNRKLALQLSDFQEPGQFLAGWMPGGFGGTAGNEVAYKFKVECFDTSGDVEVIFRRLSIAIETSGGAPTFLSNGINTFNLNFGGYSPADTWGALKDQEFRLQRSSATGFTKVRNIWIECRSYVDLARTVVIAEPPTIKTSNWPGRESDRKLLLRKDVVPARGRTNLYISARGIKYGSWTDAGGRSNGHNEGEVIEEVAGVIEYILRELMGVPTAEIDLASFDAVGNTSTGTRRATLSVTGTVYSFADTASVYTIHRSSGSFITDGFVPGLLVTVDSTSNLNDGTYTVMSVTASDLTVTEAVTTETAAAAGSTTLSAPMWRIAGSIGSVQRAMEYCRQMCREFGLILYQDPDDASGELRWRLVPLPTTSSTVTDTVAADVLDSDNRGFDSLFDVSFTPSPNVRNDIYVNYKKNYVTDKYDDSAYLSAVAGDGVMTTNLRSEAGALRGTDYTGWMELSQTKYGVVNAVTYDCDFIQDRTTAELLLRHLADWFAFRRMRVLMNLTRNLDTLTMRIGDVLEITHALLGTNHSGVSKFMVTRMNYPAVGESVPPYITLEVEEIPSAITGART